MTHDTAPSIRAIAPDTYRINIPLPDALPGGFSFNQYLLVDDKPLLFHTGPKKLFPLIREQIETVMPLSKLRYVAFSHFEADECGSLPEFLAAAPEARPVCSDVAAMVSVADFVDVAPIGMRDGEEALRVMGPRFAQIYGQGESPMTLTVLPQHVIADAAHPRYRERLQSVGYAQVNVEIAIRDESGRDLPAGEVGEVCARGPTVMQGYWNNEEATASTLRDGWLHTGDVGCFDADGFLTLKDRSKDVIISGGSNIYPREVEEVLLAHPRVREVSVVGIPDAEWGEAVVAFVVGENVAPEELDALCLAHIARFKRPKQYRFVAELPKSNYGKVLKTELRRMLRRE